MFQLNVCFLLLLANYKNVLSSGGDKGKSRFPEAVLAETSRSKLGSVDVNSDKFKAMIEKKSRHTHLIDVRTYIFHLHVEDIQQDISYLYLQYHEE